MGLPFFSVLLLFLPTVAIDYPLVLQTLHPPGICLRVSPILQWPLPPPATHPPHLLCTQGTEAAWWPRTGRVCPSPSCTETDTRRFLLFYPEY